MEKDKESGDMVVTLHKENGPDFSVEESAFETVGITVENAVSVSELEELIAELRENEEHMVEQGVLEWAEGIKESADKLEELINE